MKKEPNVKTSLEVRELALEAVYNVLEKGAYTNLILDKLLRKSKLSQLDKNLVTEIVNGTIRMLKHLDWVLNLFLKKPINKQNPWLKNIFRITLYQLLFMDRIPDYACVNDAVELSRKKVGKGITTVTNGVLRNILRNRDLIQLPSSENRVEYLSVFYSQPEWLVQKWLSELGAQTTENILIYFNQRASLILRNNELKGNRDSLIMQLKAEGIQCQASSMTPWGVKIDSMNSAIEELRTYQKGMFYVQNEASMLAVTILNPRPGDKIIDLCCGVGGKSTHIAEMMNNTGQVEAYDIYEHKISILKDNCYRMGISIIKDHPEDILDIDSTVIKGQGVLLDAPCSGLGVLNRRADSRWNKTPDMINALQDLQRRLIQKAGELVLPDGLLVYSTCTINIEENEAIIAEFLNNNSHYILEGFDNEISFFPLDDIDKYNASRGMLTILPGKYSTDGMFYARLRRKLLK